MLNWLKRLFAQPRESRRNTAAAPPKAHEPAMSGKYSSLHKYLANRYADTVVLTFADIEDLLGFALPEGARSRPDWWTNGQLAAAGHTAAWLLAKRSAKPNLLNQTVVFERTSA